MTQKIFFASKYAHRYDTEIRQLIPGYDVFHDLVRAIIRESFDRPARILSVGSGTGFELVELGREHPAWSLVGVEPDPGMNAIASQMIDDYQLSSAINLHEGYLSTLETDAHFDAALVMLTLHFVQSLAAKRQMLRDLFDRLNPGGMMILVDIYQSRVDGQFEQHWQYWKARQLAQGFSPAEVEKIFNRLKRNIFPMPEDELLKLLRNIGFQKVQQFFQTLAIGGWLAVKAGRPG